MHVCLRSLRGELKFAQALFFERVREATDSHDVLQPQEDQVEGDVVEGVAADSQYQPAWSDSRRLAACKDTSNAIYDRRIRYDSGLASEIGVRGKLDG